MQPEPQRKPLEPHRQGPKAPREEARRAPEFGILAFDRRPVFPIRFPGKARSA